MPARPDVTALLAAPALAALLLVNGPLTAAERTSVNVVSPWEVASADPVVSGFAIQKLQIMESLVDADAEGTLRPGLATDWSVSEDGSRWLFSLRDGVRFHDGTPLDASAVAQALNRAFEQPGVLAQAPITGILAEDDRLVVELERPFAALPALLAHATTVIPAPGARDADGVPASLIGTGPFRVTTFSPPQAIEMARFDDYWGEAPGIETASYLAAGRAETRAAGRER